MLNTLCRNLSKLSIRMTISTLLSMAKDSQNYFKIMLGKDMAKVVSISKVVAI